VSNIELSNIQYGPIWAYVGKALGPDTPLGQFSLRLILLPGNSSRLLLGLHPLADTHDDDLKRHSNNGLDIEVSAYRHNVAGQFSLPVAKKKLWGGEFWSDGYFSSTVGKYVKNQGNEYQKLHSDHQLKLF